MKTNKYYKVLVKFEEVHDVLVKADNEIEAKEIALRDWGSDDPLTQEIYVYDVLELQEKPNGNKSRNKA